MADDEAPGDLDVETTMKKWITASVATMALAVALAASSPEAARSKYFETSGAGFAMSPDEGVRYALSFGVREVVNQAVYVLFLFENPEKGESPLEKVVVLEPGSKELLVQSDRLTMIRNNKTYLVQMFLYADEARTRSIGTHEQEVLFSVPRQYLKQFESDYAIKIK
jgi:hypothetical protein